ncbi:MAG: ABC transporter ATP-binding protein [Nocardioides sp.]
MNLPDRPDADTQESLLEVRGLSRSFDGTAALDMVSLAVRENEFFALVGPSGCGKTTLLRTIAGFETADAGSVFLGGSDLLSIPASRRPVNLMFQSYALFPHMSVEKNIAYGLERERLPRGEIRQRVGEALETVGLSALAKRRPAQLSGGQRQRVALARAMIKRPKLLLLDEPLSALDPKVRTEMQIELKRLQHEVGISFVIVTHDQREAMSMADRIAVMAHGRVQQVDTPVALYEEPANLFVAGFIGTGNLIAGQVSGGVFTAPELAGVPINPRMQDTDEAHLLVRPEHVRIVAPEGGQVVGSVVGTQFHGAISTVVVDAGAVSSAPFMITIPGVADVAIDTTVGLTWEQCAAVPDELR